MESKVLIFISLITVCWARAPMPDLTDVNFENDCISLHNTDRAINHSPNLVLNSSLVQYAKSRCQLVSQYNGLSYGHTGLANGIGENLYWYENSNNVTATASMGIQAWYNESAKYNYNNPGNSSGTGHFTQLVWKSSATIGCARCGGKGVQYYETYIVCDYYPAGNDKSHNYQYYKTNVTHP